MVKISEIKNKFASNKSGARADFMYKNLLDQKRYINVLSFVKDKKILDCACGVGWGSYLMARAGAKQVVGIDLSNEAIETAKKYYNFDTVIYLKDDIYDFKYEEKFDIITSFETLEHVEDPLKFLNAFSNLSKNETVLFLSTPNGFCFKKSNEQPYNPYHKNEFTKDELFKLIELSKWSLEEYLGQHPMNRNSKEIDEYRKFISRFWIDKLRSERYGYIYSLAGKVYRRLFNKKLEDPAHLNNCSPIEIINDFEPAYHYLKLKLKK